MKRITKRTAAITLAALSGFWTAPAAHANSDELVVCIVLDQYPNTYGVMEVLRGLLSDGYSGYEAGVVLGQATRDVCPEHRALVTRVVNEL